MPNLNQTFAPAEAERGKFAPLTSDELTTLGQTVTGSRGRYAILTYQVGSAAVSGQVVQTISPNSIESVQIETVSNAISSTSFDNAPVMHYIELQNNGAQPIYVTHSETTYPVLSAIGLSVAAGAFYSTNHAGDLWIGSGTAGIDVRVVGHYSE
tara:strand:- start:1228 stop:1689 length:462 start_codon:yes stop_codon:yes gene_type:complete